MRDILIKTLGGLLAIFAGLFGYIFWPEQAQVFSRPVAEVRAVLQGLNLPPHVFGPAPKKVTVLTPSPDTIVWSVSEYEKEEMRYVVTLAAEGAKATRVKLDATKPGGAPLGFVGAPIRNRATRNVYIVAMQEQMAAALEQRSFQTFKIVMPTAIAVLVHLVGMSASPV